MSFGYPFPIIEETTETIQEVSKSQNIRIMDVFVIGPIMIYGGYQAKMHESAKILLILSGMATIYYNGKNYLANKRRLNASNETRT